MPSIEKEQQNVESTEALTGDELLKLKRETAEDIIHKMQDKDLGILSVVFENYIVDYLVNEGTLSDFLNDELVLGNVGKAVGIVNPTLKRYREKLNEAETKTDLEKLKTEIFNEISSMGQSESASKSSSEGQNSSSETVGSPTSGNTETSGTASSSSGTAEKMKDDNSNASTEKAKEGSGESHEIDRFDIIVSPEVKNSWENLKGKEKPDLEPYACAMKAYEIEKADLKNKKYVTVIDFTKNQLTQNRFFVINLETSTVEYAEKCGHGEGSGGKEWAESFGNKSGSRKTSLGAFITADKSTPNGKRSWWGNRGHGTKRDAKNNSNLYDRYCAIHPVGSFLYRNSGKLTSEGCYTIPKSQKYVNEILHKIEGGSLVFAYAKSRDYFAKSDYFQQGADGSVTA